MEAIYKELAALIDNGKFEEALPKCQAYIKEYPDDASLFWRAASCFHNLGEAATSKNEKKSIFEEGLEMAKKALELDDQQSGSHKWYGICLADVANFKATKEKIQHAYTIKESFEKAIEICPTDAGLYLCIGAWCNEVAGLSWLERKAASLFFAKPPESSYEEALQWHLKCEEVDPTFKQNMSRLAQLYLKLKKYEEAKHWAEKCTGTTNKFGGDIEAHDNALQVLKKL